MDSSSSSSSPSYFTDSPSPATPPPWKYDVFLTFRGQDTRKGFTDRLYTSLKWQGIVTFRDDDELWYGNDISLGLLTAIEESRISLVILSTNYASSSWCLEELAKILQCKRQIGQTVLPVFYGVDPSDVRKQKGSFAEAFAKHQQNFRDDKDKVGRWRNALVEVANLKGWDSRDMLESDLIKQISEVVLAILHAARTRQEFVGIDSKINQLQSLLDTGSTGAVLVGIWGMGGVGKTTVARAVYDRIHQKYEVSSFVANVREHSQRGGLMTLQRQLLSRFITKYQHLDDVDEGSELIGKFLRHKKVLLVLDDVDHVDQLDAFVKYRDWFSSASRVIIVTRNETLLTSFGVETRYEVQPLENEDALRLLSLNAFKKAYPEAGYLDLTIAAVEITGGLPLAIKVLGSFLHKRGVDEWNSALHKLKRAPNGEIFGTLKLSFDGLDWMEKEIFLDIACFFPKKKLERAVEILDGCGFNSRIVIEVLVEKSLLSVLGDRLWMHDMLQDMAREIVRQESSRNPGRRSRLWYHKDVIQVLTNNLGTEAVQSIFCKCPSVAIANCDPKVFSKTVMLRLLNIRNVQFCHRLECLPSELRYLKWKRYPWDSLPIGFEPTELVELHICRSDLKQLWNGNKHLDKLKNVKLRHASNLLKTPDFTGAPNLENLDLEACENLVEIHPSIWILKRLVVLNLKDCKKLCNFPAHIEIVSLRTLVLSGCSKVRRIPEFSGNMERLTELFLDGTSISKLPLSVEGLSGLTVLNLKDCFNLVCLPSVINLKSLKSLDISGCSRLSNLPENIGNIERLEELDVSGTAISEVPSSIALLKSLEALSLRGCKGPSINRWWSSLIPSSLVPRRPDPRGLVLPALSGLHKLRKLDLSYCGLRAIPDGLDCLASLNELCLSGNDIVHLPSGMSQLSKLYRLKLQNCRNLVAIPELPSEIEVRAEGCSSLEALALPSDLKFTRQNFCLLNCFKLIQETAYNSIALIMLLRHLQTIANANLGFDVIIPGSEIPKWFDVQSEGDSVRHKFRAEKSDRKWMGYAVCAVFTAQVPGYNAFGYGKYKTRILYCDIKCKGGQKRHGPPFWFSVESDEPKREHIWMCYLPLHECFDPKAIEESEIEFCFEAVYGSVLKVNKCGVRLLGEEDIEELNRRMGASEANAVTPGAFKGGSAVVVSECECEEDTSSSSAVIAAKRRRELSETDEESVVGKRVRG